MSAPAASPIEIVFGAGAGPAGSPIEIAFGGPAQVLTGGYDVLLVSLVEGLSTSAPTFDSATLPSGLELSVADRRVMRPAGTGAGTARSVSAKASGVWVATFKVTSPTAVGVGFLAAGHPGSSDIGASAQSWAVWSDGSVRHDGASTATWSAFSEAIVAIAFDFAAGHAWAAVNGVWDGSPEDGTGPTWTFSGSVLLGASVASSGSVQVGDYEVTTASVDRTRFTKWSELVDPSYRIASAGYVSHATDTPPHTYWDGRVLGDVSLSQSIAVPGDEADSTFVAIGELELANADGALSDWSDELWRDRSARIDRLKLRDAYAEAEVLLEGVVDRLESVGTDNMRLILRGRDAVMERHLTVPVFADTVPEVTLRGRPKPHVIGTAYHVPLIITDDVDLLYTVHSATPTVASLHDRGVEITVGIGYALSGEQIERLTAPDGRQVATVTAGSSGLLSWLEDSLTLGGVSLDLIDWASAEELAEARPWALGWLFDAPPTLAEVLKLATRSLGAWWATSAEGRIQFGLLEDPAVATASDVLDRTNSMQLTWRTSGARALSNRAVGRRNWSPHRLDELADACTIKSELQAEWITEKTTTRVIADCYAHALNAPPMQTALIEATDVQSFVDAVADRWKVERRFFELDTIVPAQLNDVLQISWPPFGFDLKAVVVGRRLRGLSPMSTLTLWG